MPLACRSTAWVMAGQSRADDLQGGTRRSLINWRDLSSKRGAAATAAFEANVSRRSLHRHGDEMEGDLKVDEWPEWQFFDDISISLVRLINSTKEADSGKIGVLYPFLDSIKESSVSLSLLLRSHALRDSYVIARVIYETSINACFLLTDPTRLSERARVHAAQKTLRSLVRLIEVAGTKVFEFKHRSTDLLMQQPTHKLWLEEFTSRSGREVTSWTPETVQQRLEAIYLMFGEEPTRGLAFGLLLYRHASEIAHGTLYGTLFSWGATEIGRPLTSPEDLGTFRRAELRHLLKLVCFTLESLIRVASKPLGVPNLDASAKDALDKYYKLRDISA